MGVLGIKETSLDVIADSFYDSEAALVKELDEKLTVCPKTQRAKTLLINTDKSFFEIFPEPIRRGIVL